MHSFERQADRQTDRKVIARARSNRIRCTLKMELHVCARRALISELQTILAVKVKSQGQHSRSCNVPLFATNRTE